MSVTAGEATRIAVLKTHERSEALGGLLKSTENLREFAEQQSRLAKHLEQKEHKSKFKKKKRSSDKKDDLTTQNEGSTKQKHKHFKYKKKGAKSLEITRYNPQSGSSSDVRKRNTVPEIRVNNHTEDENNIDDILKGMEQTLGIESLGQRSSSPVNSPVAARGRIPSPSPSPSRRGHSSPSGLSYGRKQHSSEDIFAPKTELYNLESDESSQEDEDVDVDNAVTRAERLKAQSMELFPKCESNKSDDETDTNDTTGCNCWCRTKRKTNTSNASVQSNDAS